MNNSHRFFCNKDCEYFPCHKTDHPDEFNCLFCFCPLYSREDCGGAYFMIPGEKPIKDCSSCTLPHSPNGWSHIINLLTKK